MNGQSRDRRLRDPYSKPKIGIYNSNGSASIKVVTALLLAPCKQSLSKTDQRASKKGSVEIVSSQDLAVNLPWV